MGKRLLFAGIGIAAIGTVLSGCNTAGLLGLPGGSTPTDVQNIQAEAVKICGWLPVAETIVSLIPVVPATANTLADQIANEIFRVVTAPTTPRPAARGALMSVLVNGQTVQGSFVRR
jgi:hypothetical protein